MKNSVSKVSINLCFYIVIGMILQIVYGFVFGKYKSSSWYYLGSMLVPVYMVSFPLFLLFCKGLVKPLGDKKKAEIKPLKFLKWGAISFFLAVLGFSFGSVFDFFLLDTSSHIEGISGSALWLRIIVMSFIAPIVEEVIFRKVLIDICSKINISFGVFFSALCFGLSHGNITQFFLGFFCGLLWGYVYAKTGKLLYSIVFHIFVNLTINIYALCTLDKSGVVNICFFTMITLLTLCGLICFILFVIKVDKKVLKKRIKECFGYLSNIKNVGFFIYLILCCSLFFLNYA